MRDLKLIKLFIEKRRIQNTIPRTIEKNQNSFTLILYDDVSFSFLGKTLHTYFEYEDENEDLIEIHKEDVIGYTTEVTIPKRDLKNGYNKVTFIVDGKIIGIFAFYMNKSSSEVETLDVVDDNRDEKGTNIKLSFKGNEVNGGIVKVTLVNNLGEEKTIKSSGGRLNTKIDLSFIDDFIIELSEDTIRNLVSPKTSDNNENLNITKKRAPETYVHTVEVPLDTWDITHPLSKYPSVTVIDSSGNEVKGAVEYISTNRLIIRFNNAFSGRASLN